MPTDDDDDDDVDGFEDQNENEKNDDVAAADDDDADCDRCLIVGGGASRSCLKSVYHHFSSTRLVHATGPATRGALFACVQRDDDEQTTQDTQIIRMKIK